MLCGEERCVTTLNGCAADYRFFWSSGPAGENVLLMCGYFLAASEGQDKDFIKSLPSLTAKTSKWMQKKRSVGVVYWLGCTKNPCANK